MKLLCYFLILTFLFTQDSYANAKEFEEHEARRIKQAEDYINNLKTMTANFTQISPYSKIGVGNISVSKGNLYLSKPGKALWEYIEPVPQTLLINDHKIVYHDQELEQVSYLDIDHGLSAFLTSEKIDFFSGQFKVVDYSEDQWGFNVVLQEDKDKKEDTVINEQLRLTFLQNPLRLSRFNFKDMAGRITTVEFQNLKQDVVIDEEKFVFKNPKIGKNVWEKK